jgi:hypothetical protein
MALRAAVLLGRTRSVPRRNDKNQVKRYGLAWSVALFCGRESAAMAHFCELFLSALMTQGWALLRLSHVVEQRILHPAASNPPKSR